MKKILIFTFIFIFLIASFAFVAYAEPGVSAKAAIVMVADTKEVVFEKNAHEKLPMASTTKIMTSLIALESGLINSKIITTKKDVSVEGTSMGLLPGDTVTLKTLVYGMLLASGNDAANTVANFISGENNNFSDIMNKRAKEIGMKDTNFVTPSGLDDENHYSTAFDMALLACEAIKNPDFLEICSSKSAFVEYGNPPYRRKLTNHNKLLASLEGTIGVKTGFTKKSGRCLVSAVERNGIVLVAVTLKDPNDWADHKKLYDFAFSLVESKEYEIKIEDKLHIIGGEKEKCSLKLAYTPNFSRLKSGKEITYKMRLKKFEYAPIEKGEILGYVDFYNEEHFLSSTPIISTEEISCITDITDSSKNSIFVKLKELWQKLNGKRKN